MNRTYSAQLENQINQKLRQYRSALIAAAVITVLLEITASVCWSVTVPVAVAMGLLTAALGVGAYAVLQRKILPLYRTDRLMKQLENSKAESFEGIFRGVAEAKAMYSGVMMYKLRLDEGKRVGKEPVLREVSIPAIFGKPRIEPGTVLRGDVAENIVVAAQLPNAQKVQPEEGRYQVSPAVTTVILIGAALLWSIVYGGVHRQPAGSVLNVGVCTPAHHEETELEVEQAMKMDGVDVVFSYTNTIEPETVAMYLATFGAMEADILILNADQFTGVFENEAHPLQTNELTQALGFEPRYAVDEAGQATGVLLYIPDEPAYNANFPKLIDWIAVEKDVALVASICYGSDHGASGQANLALVHLLTYLADK